ncbi:MAG: site-specific DNA-methyltransferase [Rhodanobacteraceae bacterium]|nr:site-specific DNA-methyltransferase [Rhodanobacteraceae bacterium]
MADDKKTNEKKQRLLTLLREMFQLDQPDLDFGLYRIMHAKRGQVEAFLETEFDQLIDKVFADRGARHEEEAKKEYEAARQQAIEFGAPDPDAAPKVQQARARYEVVRLSGGEDAEIYDHLHRFFSRYYDQGDFMSLRRYGKGAAGGAETYAVPYDGSEVVLHWANKDQYYIKTTENFAEFSFDPRKALQKDERGISRSLFDDEASKVGSGGTALKVHFRIVDAAEGAHNNVKASDKDERYFILDSETPLAWDGNELIVRINYRTDPEKTGQKAKWQDKRNEQLVQTMLDTLKGLTDGGNALAGEYFEVLASEVSKGKDKKQRLLARYVGQYTASNTMDYFIHKDLGGFLRRELDFYLKNEVLKLDDFVGGEDADVQAGLTDARMKAMKEALEKAQAMRLLSQRLIDFLAQLEEFQKKLWLKKKFVVETHYCITLDRIPEKFYPEIAANDRQREEWVKLFAIDEIKGDMATPAYSVPLTAEFLKSNPYLPVDVSLFEIPLQEQIIQYVEALDDVTTGIAAHSENFQAISLLDKKFGRCVDLIYIDPPYNTTENAIPYKNTYKHSSWMSLVENRCKKSVALLHDKSNFIFAIDDTELSNSRLMLNEIFGADNHVSSIAVEVNPAGQNIRENEPAKSHDYFHVFAVDNSKATINLRTLTDEEKKAFDLKDEVGAYLWDNLRRRGGNSRPTDRPNQWYPLYAQLNPPKVSATPFPGSTEIWPIDPQGEKRIWRVSPEGARKDIESGDISVVEKAGRIEIVKKTRMPEGRKPKTLWYGGSYSATTYGSKLLKDMLGTNDFAYPKSLHLVAESIRYWSNANSIVVDYFGGSGTTGHAVIQLNRDDRTARRFVLIEQGSYFDSVLRVRLLKAAYSSNWKGAKPISRDGTSQCFKFLRIESYEDCLNNLALNSIGDSVVRSGGESIQREYLLRYMLDVETQGSQSLLNVAQFRDPSAYQLEIKKPGSDEREKRNVDLVETFNWLIGLHIDKLHAGQRFTATFVRKPDPSLPEDANTRLQVETLTEAEDGAWWYRPVEGYVRTKPGDDRHRQSVLVLWRTLTDDPEQDAAALEAYLSQQMKFDPTRREDKTLYDIIYINGTHNLPNLGKYGEVRLLEEEFHRRMWAGEES